MSHPAANQRYRVYVFNRHGGRNPPTELLCGSDDEAARTASSIAGPAARFELWRGATLLKSALDARCDAMDGRPLGGSGAVFQAKQRCS